MKTVSASCGYILSFALTMSLLMTLYGQDPHTQFWWYLGAVLASGLIPAVGVYCRTRWGQDWLIVIAIPIGMAILCYAILRVFESGADIWYFVSNATALTIASLGVFCLAVDLVAKSRQ